MVLFTHVVHTFVLAASLADVAPSQETPHRRALLKADQACSKAAANGGVWTAALHPELEITAIGVTALADLPFARCGALTAVTLPSTVTAITPYAFYDCYSLRSVDLGTLRVIPEHAFAACSNLTAVTVPDTVTEIGASAFEGDSSLTDLALGTALRIVRPRAFAQCSKLRAVTLPSSVTEIGFLSFFGLTSMTHLELSSSLQVIAYQGFAACSNLTAVTIPTSVKLIDDAAFDSCGLAAVTIPSSVTKIGNFAFSGNHLLTSLDLGTSVQSIEFQAFRGTSVETVTLPASLTALGEEAFSHCGKLREVRLAGASISSVGPDWSLDTSAGCMVCDALPCGELNSSNVGDVAPCPPVPLAVV